MKTLPEWLEQKFLEWEKTEGGRRTYYSFARYLETGHSTLALWMSGSASPQGDDLTRLASKLGSEVFEILNTPSPSSPIAAISANLQLLPAAFQSRLASAIVEAGQAITQARLNPESIEAKRLAVQIFEKWGFSATG